MSETNNMVLSQGQSQILAASGTLNSVTITNTTLYDSVLIQNLGNVIAYVSCTLSTASSAACTTTTDVAILPSQSFLFKKKPATADTISAITAGGTTTLQVTPTVGV